VSGGYDPQMNQVLSLKISKRKYTILHIIDAGCSLPKYCQK